MYYKLLKEDNNNIINNFPINNINIKNIKQNWYRAIIPTISDNSGFYDSDYHPEALFKDSYKYNYCSTKKDKSPFIEFDFKKEYFFYFLTSHL